MTVVKARDVAAGDVIRLADDRQAHRVELVLLAEDRVTLHTRPAGLAVDATRTRLPRDATVDRLATATD